jgi:hypothetical protein
MKLLFLLRVGLENVNFVTPESAAPRFAGLVKFPTNNSEPPGN